MALARPIRALIAVSIFLWCFCLYQIFGPSSQIRLPERFKHEKDPVLECKLAKP